MNLYQTLGVRKNSSTKNIKRKFRALAKKLHPDHGGDPNRFIEAHFAYRILIDPAGRKLYDKTGKVDKASAISDAGRILATIAGQFERILSSGFRPDTNFPEAIMKNLKQEIQKNDKNIDMAEAAKKVLSKLQKSITRDDDKLNAFSILIDNKINKLDDQIDAATEHMRIARLVLQELKNYDSFHEVIQHFSAYATSSAGTGTATF